MVVWFDAVEVSAADRMALAVDVRVSALDLWRRHSLLREVMACPLPQGAALVVETAWDVDAGLRRWARTLQARAPGRWRVYWVSWASRAGCDGSRPVQGQAVLRRLACEGARRRARGQLWGATAHDLTPSPFPH
jgi:hypothetical protein